MDTSYGYASGFDVEKGNHMHEFAEKTVRTGFVRKVFGEFLATKARPASRVQFPDSPVVQSQSLAEPACHLQHGLAKCFLPERA